MSDHLGTKAVRGVAWLGGGQTIRQVIAFGTNIALARLLFPEDFGLFSMAFAAAEIAQILADFGLGAALIQRRIQDPEILTTCFWINLALGAAVAAILLALSPALSAYFQRAEIQSIIIPLAFNMVVAASMVVPQAMLTQQMRFRDLTVVQTLATIIAAVTAISLANAGAGVWALVCQPVIGNVTSAILLYATARWLPRGRPRFESVKPLLGFSGNMLGNSFVGSVGRNLHIAILGKRLGDSDLGMYNLASAVTGTIVFQISSIVVKVLFPTLSSLKDNPIRLRNAWFKACSGIAVLSFPAMAGMIAVAPDFVPLVFGEQWTPMVEPLRVLCGLMAVQSVLTTSGTVLMSLGRSDLLFRTSLASVTLIAIGLFVGSGYGLSGAAIGYMLATIPVYLLLTAMACRMIATSTSGLVAELAPWALCSVGMALCVTLLAQSTSGLPPIVRLVLCITSGAVLYPSFLFLFARSKATAIFTEIHSHLHAKRPAKK